MRSHAIGTGRPSTWTGQQSRTRHFPATARSGSSPRTLSVRPVSLCGVSSRITDPEQLKELLGIPFTPEQTACITAPPAPQVIVAGAGSGKTTVMAARVVWLVGTGQVAPEQVLGLTFTNKAAGELSERVRKALVAAGVTDPDVIDPDNPRASPASPHTTPSPDGSSPSTDCG